MKGTIHNSLLQNKKEGKKSLVILVDPDKLSSEDSCIDLIKKSNESGVDYFFVGGSLITGNNFHHTVKIIKENTQAPVILFPGSNMQIDVNADAILFLSLISGRNPELLIGQQVVAAPVLKRSKLEVLPTGYILINGGLATTVSYMSNTSPIPNDKPSIAACTAIAGEMLGMGLIYLDAGSGAAQPVPPKMIARVRKSIEAPLIVGGGLNSTNKAREALEAGADTIVLGNGIEQNHDLLMETAELVAYYNKQEKT